MQGTDAPDRARQVGRPSLVPMSLVDMVCKPTPLRQGLSWRITQKGLGSRACRGCGSADAPKKLVT